ncbi:thiol reductant ABC exporter subunit CydD [Salinisphaera orenii]|uniref:thiol reductant ABC exporter subunit CydD n=1 Tax=Salinisphaera orenii TaxID=856731 RepID=UPI000DBE803F
MARESEPRSRAAGKVLDGWLREQAASIRMPLAASVGAGLVDGALLIAQAWLLALIINAVAIDGFGLAHVWRWLWGLLAVFAGRAVATVLVQTTAFEAAARIKQAVRQRLVGHIDSLGPGWSQRQASGDVANTLIDGVESLEAYYANYLPQIALAGFIPLAILVFVFPVDWVSGLIMSITAPLIPLFMIIIGKGAERMNQRQWRRLARMSAHFFDAIEGLSTLKLFNASRREAAVVARIADDYRETTMRVLRVAFLSSLMLEFLATLSIAMVAVYIGFRLYYGQMAFLPGLFVLLLAPEFYRPLRDMGTQYHARMEAIGASEQIVEILNTEPPASSTDSTDRSVQTPLTVCFRDVGFAYETDYPVLAGIDFSLASGQRVALVGPSGSGKTTIANILLGFAVPGAGTVEVNGVDRRQLSADAWLSQVAWLPQSPTLFHGTVGDNIRLGVPDAIDAAVERAAELANAAGFIADLPQGYETLVGDRGQGLSGGQIQRIALARAFLKDAPLVVLDEPGTSLDPETEALVTESIERLARDRAVLVVAHRLDTVERADAVLVLDDGRIVEQGNPDELRARGGRFTAMVSQYRGGAS